MALRPKRTTPSIFPDSTEGMLSKAKTLTQLCPDKDAWTCVMGFVEYKLAPSADAIEQEVLDALFEWIDSQRRLIRDTGKPDGDMQGVTEAQLTDLLRRIVAHLRSL